MLYSLSKNQATYQQESQSQNSSCSQCNRNNNQPNYGEDSSQVEQQNNVSSSSQEVGSVPLRKHIVKHNYQIQHTLKLLQFQVDTLKKQNSTKQKIIGELKFQVHRSAQQEGLKLQMNKQAYEINRLRQELGCSPRNNFKAAGSKLKSSSSNFPREFQQEYIESTSPELNLKKGNFLTDDYKGRVPSNFISMNQQPTQKYALKIAILQKQVKEYQLQLMEIKQKINYFQHQNSWQKKFIYSFVKMCGQLSLNYGERLHLAKHGQDLKRKTKLSWHYMKDLIGFFVSDGQKFGSS